MSPTRFVLVAGIIGSAFACSTTVTSSGSNPANASPDGGASVTPGTGDDSGASSSKEAGAVEPPPVETTWSQVDLPTPARVRGLSAVGKELWIAASDPQSASKGFVLHYDGNDWETVKIDTAGENPNAVAVYAAAANDVFVATQYAGAVHHWDGSTWTKNDSFGVTSAYTLFGIGKEVWFGTQWNFFTSPLHHYENGSWSDQAIDDGNDQSGVYAIWGSANNDLYLRRDRLVHWNGTSAEDVADSTDLKNVYGSGKNDVWAVGTGGLIRHFDGKKWTDAKSGTTKDLTVIWTSGPNDAWAGGTDTLLHYDGKSWAPAKNDGDVPKGADYFVGVGPADAWATSAGKLYRLTEKK